MSPLKIRSAAAVTAALFSLAVPVAGASAAPPSHPDSIATAPHVAPDSKPVFQLAPTYMQAAKKAKVCDDLHEIYEQDIAEAVQIDGNADGQNHSDGHAEASDQNANQVRADAGKAGCGWAA